MELLHVLGNTYAAVAATALLPVYKLNDRDVVLIDTGYAKLDRAGLTALIDGSGWPTCWRTTASISRAFSAPTPTSTTPATSGICRSDTARKPPSP